MRVARRGRSNKDGQKKRLAIGFLIHRFSLDYGGLFKRQRRGSGFEISRRDKRNLAGTARRFEENKDGRYANEKWRKRRTRRKVEPKVREKDRRRLRKANRESLG